MVFLVTKVKYDLSGVDGDVAEIDKTLPHGMVVEVDDESLIADAISDQTGFLVESFEC